MKFGAYYNPHRKDIVWFRTNRPMEAGFYHRRTRSGEPPDVYLAESVPELIMKSHPWVHAEEAAFQDQAGSHGMSAEEKKHSSDQMAEQLVQRLNPNDDQMWVDEPHWVKHLKPE